MDRYSLTRVSSTGRTQGTVSGRQGTIPRNRTNATGEIRLHPTENEAATWDVILDGN